MFIKLKMSLFHPILQSPKFFHQIFKVRVVPTLSSPIKVLVGISLLVIELSKMRSHSIIDKSLRKKESGFCLAYKDEREEKER